jgi:hypothetical protein
MIHSHAVFSSVVFLTLACVACSPEAPNTEAVTPQTDMAANDSGADTPSVVLNPLREAYFGNLHVHTSYSFDGYTNGSVTSPDDAYRWAKGEAIPGGGDGSELKILRPLDWYVVSDHAEYLGVFRQMANPNSPLSQLAIAERVTSDDQAVAFQAYSDVLNDMSAGIIDPQLADPVIGRTIWIAVVATADEHNEPGSFTTFPGYEWTSNPGKQNLHRVVVFANSDGVPELPFSAIDSDRPEDLWQWMDELRSRNVDSLAIAHNGNASNGLMFPAETSYGGSTVDGDYAATRMRNEPVYELTQIKGTSETHPMLSPNDEFGGFELWDYTLSADALPPRNRKGGYARDAYLTGLILESSGQENPYKFGVIGDSDTHNSASMIEEDNYRGKFGMEKDAEHRLNGIPGFPEANNRQVREFSSGGVAGIWAEANTREAIFAAFQRKETFATSGPRMKVRFFAGYEFDANTLASKDWIQQAYEGGVPMGGDLGADGEGRSPVFLVVALMEPDGANLDRIQIVKGWIENGQAVEKIYDIALSDDRKVDASGEVPPVGNTVDPETASYTNSIGDTQLKVAWTDPDFDAAEHAFYYVRVLQIPTPRWSTYDAVSLGISPREDLPVTIQERAWSSPIWYRP